MTTRLKDQGVTSKADQAYAIVRSKVLDGTCGPGYRLVIDQLVREHGISSVPWRESLRRLEAEGWVEIVPHVGAVVRGFDDDEWRRTILVLSRLEALAIAQSAPLFTTTDIAHARDLSSQVRDAIAVYDTADVSRLNREFFRHLCSRCEDPRLLELVERERTRVDLIRRASGVSLSRQMAVGLARNEEIVDLIESGANGAAIEQALHAHVAAVIAEVVDSESVS